MLPVFPRELDAAVDGAAYAVDVREWVEERIGKRNCRQYVINWPQRASGSCVRSYIAATICAR
jgi:predicted methyltransferase MtxX (methanogen marker protein 4)